VIRNGGRLVHGFEIEIEERGDNSGPGSSHDDGLKMEGPAFGPGETVRLGADLAPGVYEIECFVAEHDDMGMRATLVVRRDAPLVRVERPSATSDSVEIADFAFLPRSIEVDAGTTVTWHNADPTAHTVSARDGAFDSGTLDPGSGFETTFAQPGTFAYFCQIHPTMRGSVRVVAG
jgi:plastocyanin